MLKNLVLVACAIVLNGGAYAETEVPNTFEAGGDIIAAEINDNFTALEEGIAALATRLDALESGGGTSIIGNSYTLRQIGVLIRGNNVDDITVGNLTQSYTLSLADDMTFVFTGTENESETQASSGNVSTLQNGEAVNDSGTYSVAGQTLTLNWAGGGSIAWVVSLDGQSLLLNTFGARSSDGGSWFRTESSLIVGIRTQ